MLNPEQQLTEQSLSDCLNMMLAGEMARIYRLNPAAKVKKIARRIRNKTQDKDIYHLFGSITRAPDALVMDGMDQLYRSFVKDGLI